MYIHIYTYTNRLSHEVERAAIAIAEAAERLDAAEGRVAASLAGASIMMACLLRMRTPDWRIPAQISEATGAAEATIRLTFKELYAKRCELVPEWYAPREAVEAISEH